MGTDCQDCGPVGASNVSYRVYHTLDDDDSVSSPQGPGRDKEAEASYNDLYSYHYLDSESLDENANATATDISSDRSSSAGEAVQRRVPDATCENTCEYARDGYCDDGRDDFRFFCKIGTDCQDCGPVGASNFTHPTYPTMDDDYSMYYLQRPGRDKEADALSDDLYNYHYLHGESLDEKANAKGTKILFHRSYSASGSKESSSYENEVDNKVYPFPVHYRVTADSVEFSLLVVSYVFVAILILAAWCALRCTCADFRKSEHKDSLVAHV